jgi:hypothetical protein
MQNLTTVFSSGTNQILSFGHGPGLEPGKALIFGSSPGYRDRVRVRDRDRSWSRASLIRTCPTITHWNISTGTFSLSAIHKFDQN